MPVINTNVAATITSNALAKNERAMGQAMERLSTGQRINSAADDAAGLAISSKMTSQVRGLDQAVRNGNDAISMIQTADGALIEVSNMLQRMRELAVQAATGTNGDTDKAALQTEFAALRSQIDSIATGTTWNGEKVFGQTADVAKGFQVGANAGQQISVTFKNFQTAGNSGATIVNSQFVSLNSNANGLLKISDINLEASMVNPPGIVAGNPNDALYMLDKALANVSTERATYGAAINRLEYAVDNLANVSQNTAASRSRILDADYASESTELARTQIIQQAGTAMLAQANQQAQSVLALLK
jgi:flagellin